MKIQHTLPLALLVFAACAKSGPTNEYAPQASLGSRAVTKTASHSSGLVGRWSAEIVMPEAKGDDPAERMALEMAKAFAGSMWLELRDDGTFTLSMILPIEGTWKRDGSSLSLTPTKFMGMSEADFKKQAAESGGEAKFDSEPMRLDVLADGQTLRLKSDDPDEGELLFKKTS